MCGFLQMVDDIAQKSFGVQNFDYYIGEFSYLSDSLLSMLLCQAYVNIRLYLNSIEDKNNIFDIDDFDQFLENKDQIKKVMDELSLQKNELENTILARKNKLQTSFPRNKDLADYIIGLMGHAISARPSKDERLIKNLQDLLKQLINIAYKHYQDQTPLIKEQHPKIIIISTNIYRLVNRDQLFPLDSQLEVFNWPAFNKTKYDHIKCLDDFKIAVNRYVRQY
jgi:hypothetical protein